MSAILSPCGLFRYRLERPIQPQGIVAALFGVNPSTADATVNDHTIVKDIGFGRVNGWRHLIKGNVFAYRATDVTRLAHAADPIGPENDYHLARIIEDADVLVPCWGRIDKVPSVLRGDFADVLDMLRASGKPVMIFGLTSGGYPKHPLMLPYSTQLQRY